MTDSAERDLNIFPLVDIGPRPGVIGRDSFHIAYSPSRWANYFALSHDDLAYLLQCEAELLSRRTLAQPSETEGSQE